MTTKQPYPWTPRAFQRRLERYDLTPEQAADLVGAKRRSGYYWQKHGPPYVVALVFALMERFELTPEELEEVGMQLTKKHSGG